MKEELLQFLWKFKLFDFLNLKTTEGEKVEILNVGQHNFDEGPDFLNTRLRIGEMQWNGPVELHLRASDWELHQHTQNVHYENIIAHIVYENDKEIPYLKEKNIPTIELKNHISQSTIYKYEQLSSSSEKLICTDWAKDSIEKLPIEILYSQWVIEKWQMSALKIKEVYDLLNQHWEATLWTRLAYTFGLKINADIFEQMALDIPFTVVQKTAQSEFQILALLHGKAGLLHHPKDEFQEQMAEEYEFITHKYNLNSRIFPPKFMRLRPAAFPTIRLALLAQLYHKQPNLFSKIIQMENVQDIRKMLEKIQLNSYFDTHYTYNKVSEGSPKKLSAELINSILINAVLPIQFAYFQSIGKSTEKVLESLRNFKKEKNYITKTFEQAEFPNENAMHSQAIIQHYKSHCSQKKCLFCTIGLQMMKNDE